MVVSVVLEPIFHAAEAIPRGLRVSELHRPPDARTGRKLWNARNRKGEIVASGVYLYVIEDLDGRARSRSGRFAVVR